MFCTILLVLQVMFPVIAILLLAHHYNKHDNLDGCERWFQPEDVCVCCLDRMDRPVHNRCSHEMYVVLCIILCIVSVVVYHSTGTC
jgi:quinol-cytochrome oxidoreductase complex cytochrome b subunit